MENKKMAEYRQNDMTNYDGEAEQAQEVKAHGGGNTGLPFGLCKKYGISLPKDAQPRDAWNALEGIGITPESVYKALKATGKAEDIKPANEVKKYNVTRHKIDEDGARRAKESYSMWGYNQGSATREYEGRVSQFEKNVNDLVEKYKNNDTLTDEDWAKIDSLAEAYGKRYANYVNESNRIEASYPSWVIAGPANYNVKKSNAKYSRLHSLYQENEEYLNPDDNPYLRKIRDILSNASIQSGDRNALVKLQAKLKGLEENQDQWKAQNAHWRKYGTMKGFPGVSDEKAQRWDAEIKDSLYKTPAAPYMLQNNNANMKRIKDRIASIEKEKAAMESGEKTTYPDVDGVEVEENANEMRIQLRFPGKPDEATRTLLKSNGFRWAPSQSAWQRQLTGNGKRAARSVLAELKKRAN